MHKKNTGTSSHVDQLSAQKHFLWTMEGPDSSYSCFEIHICWKVEREARMEPPIQTEYFLSGGAMILIFMVLGARAVISFCILSKKNILLLNLSHRSNDVGLLTNLFGFEESSGFKGIKTKIYCQISKITNNNEKMWFQIDL